MIDDVYMHTRFPSRVWEQTCGGKWVSRPVDAETKAARASILSQLAGCEQEYNHEEDES